MVKIFNVGQGDSFLFNAGPRCHFGNEPLLIDCGRRGSNVIRHFAPSPFSLMLTHSHSDHIGGLNQTIANVASVIFIPFYLPEVLEIHKYLRRYIYTGTRGLNLMNRHYYGKLRLVGEGDMLCDHLQILNPPKRKAKFNHFRTSNYSIQRAIEVFREFNIELNLANILEYRSPEIGFLNENNELNNAYREDAQSFFRGFFISTAQILDENRQYLESDRSRGYLRNLLLSSYTLNANQASIVFKHEFGGTKYLFTGDADTNVFYRIERDGHNIQSNFLKVPHHGSRHCLDRHILGLINPDVAVVSHNNRRFGRSTDPHPHREVIDLLDNLAIETHYTNDVIKDRIVNKGCTRGIVNSHGLSFEFI